MAAAVSVLLGLLNLLLLYFNHRPSFRLHIPFQHYFTGKWRTDDIVAPEERESSFIKVLLDVRNNSDRDNTIIAMECKGRGRRKRRFTKLPDCPIIIGEKAARPLWEAMDKKLSIYWKPPVEQWDTMIPCFLPCGGHKVLPVCYRVRGEPIPDGQTLRIKITVRDSYGKKYSQVTKITHLASGRCDRQADLVLWV